MIVYIHLWPSNYRLYNNGNFGKGIWINKIKEALTSFVLRGQQWLIEFRIVSSIYWQISRLGNYQNLSYKQFSNTTQNRKLLLWTRCVWSCCALTTLFNVFFAMPVATIYKTMLLHKMFSLGSFLRTYYYCDGERALIQQQPSFNYRFWDIFIQYN